MKHLFTSLFILFGLIVAQSQTLPLALARTYETAIFDDGGTEIITWDKNSKRLFSTNRSQNKLDILELLDIKKPKKIASIDLSIYISKVNSASVFNSVVAVVGEGNSPQNSGKLLFFDKDGNFLNQFTVGPMPDMVTHTPGGNKVIVANEGEPSDDYISDPAGSVSILDISFGVNNISQSDMVTVSFVPLDSQAIDPLINVYGNNGQQLVSQDLEPEYITVNSNSTKAYVSLQENNAIMIIDINTGTIDTVKGLGYVDRSISGNGLDASDVNTSIDISTYQRLFGMYQPDAIAAFESNGTTYIATANEGDSRMYSAYSEEATVKTLPLHPGKFSNIFSLIADTELGNLRVTTSIGDNDNDGLMDSLFTFGGRSFSIWDENLQLIWDSGDDFEQIIAAAHASNFNSTSNDNNSFKDRSDDRGPEPEALAIGEIDGTPYAFIGLERMGGFMMYDISDPTNPQFKLYELNRDFSKAASEAGAGDLGPESIVFVPAIESPTGLALIIVANEVSGTISIYETGVGVGLDEKLDARTLKAYPNPSSGKVNLSQYGTYKVYNAQGKFIKKVKNENAISLEGESEGLYIIYDSKGNLTRIIKKD